MTIASAHFTIAGCVIEIVADDAYLRWLPELNVKGQSGREPDMVLALNVSGVRVVANRMTGPISLNDRNLVVNMAPGVTVSIHRHCAPLRVDVSIRPSRNQRVLGATPRPVQRWVSSEYEPVFARTARSLMHYVLYPLVELFLLQRGKSLLHAACISRHRVQPQALVLTGWGGMGKTGVSTRLLLRTDTDWRFISDDMLGISSSGVVYSNPSVAHIYPYNVQQFKNLGRAVSQGRSVGDRMHWRVRSRLLGPKGVRRRLLPEAMYAEANGEDIPMGLGIMLDAGGGSEIAVQECSASAMANHSANVTIYEVGALLGYTVGMGALDAIDPARANALRQLGLHVSSLEGLYERLRTVYEAAFSGVPCYRIATPRGYPLDALAHEVEMLAGNFGL